MARIVCFGELLLRFCAPGHERLLQSGRLHVHCGGAEANVAVSLARFGHDVRMISALPDNPLGRFVLSQLQSQGVDVSPVILAPDGRLGTYFLETGAVRRPSKIVYDRAHSVFASTDADAYPWPQLLDGADWLHLSGITPATGPGPAQAAEHAVAGARELGVKVAFDGNYREALWRGWGGDGRAVLRRLLQHATTAFINERDIALALDTPVEPRADAVARAFDAFPSLEIIAATTRQQTSVAYQTLSGELYRRDGVWRSKPHALDGVVDRIGGGDAFAAGVLHALMTDAHADPQTAIEFGCAAGAIKHSIPGDANLTTIQEIEDAMDNTGLDVRR